MKKVSDPAGLAKLLITEAGDDKRVWLSAEGCAILEMANAFSSQDSGDVYDRLMKVGVLGEIEVWVDAMMPTTTARFHPSDPESDQAREIDTSAYVC